MSQTQEQKKADEVKNDVGVLRAAGHDDTIHQWAASEAGQAYIKEHSASAVKPDDEGRIEAKPTDQVGTLSVPVVEYTDDVEKARADAAAEAEKKSSKTKS